MRNFTFELGVTVRDVVTGFTGVATGAARYLTGCDQYCVSPVSNPPSKREDSCWFDENRLVVVKNVAKVQLPNPKPAERRRGGPSQTPAPRK